MSQLIPYAIDITYRSINYVYNAIINYKEEIDRYKLIEFSTGGFPIVKHEKAFETFEKAFNNPDGGIHIIIAPVNSGKSAYISEFCKEYVKDSKNKVIQFESGNFNRDTFYKRLGIDPSNADRIFEIIDKKTVIVIDQFENIALTREQRELIHSIGSSSYNKKRNVVILVSKIVNAKILISLNGGEKIRQSGRIDDFMWDAMHIRAFIDNYPNVWTDDQKEFIITQAQIAGSPGLLVYIARLEIFDENDIQKKAIEYRDRWIEFTRQSQFK